MKENFQQKTYGMVRNHLVVFYIFYGGYLAKSGVVLTVSVVSGSIRETVYQYKQKL
jgi:hypothetical protein